MSLFNVHKKSLTAALVATLSLACLSYMPTASSDSRCQYFHEYDPSLSQSFQWWFDHIAVPHSGRVVNIPSEIELACTDSTIACGAKFLGDTRVSCFETMSPTRFPLTISPDKVCATFGHGKARQALLVYVWCPTS